MSWFAFAAALPEEELEKLAGAVWARQNELARKRVMHLQLNDEEVLTLDTEGKIAAVKSVRQRLSLPLRESLQLVERIQAERNVKSELPQG